MKSFQAHLYNSFVRTNGWLIGGIGTVATFISAYFFVAGDKVGVGWLAVTIAISILITVILIDAAYVGWRESQNGLPEIKQILDAPTVYKRFSKLLIASPSELFGVDVLVSVYMNEDEYERLIGIGQVLSIQINGYIQIGMTTISGTDDGILEKLDRNDASLIKKLLVKPSVPSYLLESQNV